MSDNATLPELAQARIEFALSENKLNIQRLELRIIELEDEKSRLVESIAALKESQKTIIKDLEALPNG